MRYLTAPRTAALAVATLLALTGCGDGTNDAGSTGATTSASPSPTDSAAPTDGSSPSDAGSQDSGEQEAAAVYFVGDAPQGLRLFREFRQVPAADALTAAATLLTSGDTLDPDYRSLFPEGAFDSVTLDESAGSFVVELADEGWTTRPDGMTGRQARLAVQQLVHTLQAVAQQQAPVVVTVGGEPTALFGVDTADGVTRADPLDVLGLVNVTTPEQDGTVQGSFRASGVASSFEGTVPWEIRRDGTVVKEGFATAEGWMDKLHPWQTDEIDVSDLKPGRYTFVASTSDPSDGEGFGPTRDTKEFTVR